jgi:hypothetical protein
VDAGEEGLGAALREATMLWIAHMEEHPVAAAVLAGGLDRPVALLLDPVDGWAGGIAGGIPRGLGKATISLEHGAHDACLVPNGIAN